MSIPVSRLRLRVVALRYGYGRVTVVLWKFWPSDLGHSEHPRPWRFRERSVSETNKKNKLECAGLWTPHSRSMRIYSPNRYYFGIKPWGLLCLHNLQIDFKANSVSFKSRSPNLPPYRLNPKTQGLNPLLQFTSHAGSYHRESESQGSFSNFLCNFFQEPQWRKRNLSFGGGLDIKAGG